MHVSLQGATCTPILTDVTRAPAQEDATRAPAQEDATRAPTLKDITNRLSKAVDTFRELPACIYSYDIAFKFPYYRPYC